MKGNDQRAGQASATHIPGSTAPVAGGQETYVVALIGTGSILEPSGHQSQCTSAPRRNKQSSRVMCNLPSILRETPPPPVCALQKRATCGLPSDGTVRGVGFASVWCGEVGFGLFGDGFRVSRVRVKRLFFLTQRSLVTVCSSYDDQPQQQ